MKTFTQIKMYYYFTTIQTLINKYAKCAICHLMNILMESDAWCMIENLHLIYNAKPLAKLPVLIEHSIFDIVYKVLNKVVI